MDWLYKGGTQSVTVRRKECLMKTSTRCPLIDATQPLVLVAEDDPDQSEMLSDVLQDEGYVVDTAFSGDVANQKLQKNTYDLIVLDIRMPGMDGETVLKRLRERERTAHVPVFVVSAFATDSDRQRYAENGATASFSKPYDIDELIEHVAVFTKKRSAT